MNKPISIIVNELRTGLISICNDSGLPVYILESVVKEIYQEIKILANEQLRRDIEEYQKSLIEEKNTEEINEPN